MYGICLLFSGFSNVYHSACVWPAALKLGCVTNLDMLFFVMGFISLIDEILMHGMQTRLFVYVCVWDMAYDI